MGRFSVQDIFTKYGPEYIAKHELSQEQWKVYNAIIKCKTRRTWSAYYYLRRMWTYSCRKQ